jgi:spermidine/putrescine ABC transporter ATP-binding subunit
VFGIELQTITKRYADTAAVDNVSFAIKPAEFLTLLGPSGCGKTTTLRIVAGLQEPDSGRVCILDRDVTGLGPADRNIGMVFQSLALFPHMTAGENVAFGLRMRRMPKGEITDRVKRVLTRVHLERFADRYPHQMSGGQQQRVALARALVIEPTILVLDEPFASLDRKLREAMQQELRAITKEFKITTLFVTHDQEEALLLSDWIAVMNRGRVEQFGRPAEIYWDPQSRFVADFTGSTNFIPARVLDAHNGAVSLLISDLKLDVPANEHLKPGDDVQAVIRPEWIQLSTSRLTVQTSLPGKLTDIVFQGDISTYVVELAGGTKLTARKSNEPGGRQADFQFRMGQQIWVSWEAEALRILTH